MAKLINKKSKNTNNVEKIYNNSDIFFSVILTYRYKIYKILVISNLKVVLILEGAFKIDFIKLLK